MGPGNIEYTTKTDVPLRVQYLHRFIETHVADIVDDDQRPLDA